MLIAVTDYQPTWKRQYETAAEGLLDALHNYGVTVGHIGSTAVEGLAAKPVIDIQISVTDLGLTKALLSKHFGEYSGPGGTGPYLALKDPVLDLIADAAEKWAVEVRWLPDSKENQS